MKKGQFMIISAVIAGLLIITLSSAINSIQSHNYQTSKLPHHINQLRDEAARITSDGTITSKEKRNFRKMASYIEDYRTSIEFDTASNCVNVELNSAGTRVQPPCMG